MTIIDTKNKKPPRFRVFAALSLAGLIFCILFVVYLKKHHVFDEEYELARKLSTIFFLAFVIGPFAFYALFMLVDKILDPLLYKILSRIHQRRIEKYGYKKVSREDRYNRRINKILGQHVACLLALIYLCWFVLICLVLGIRRIQIPEGNLSDDNLTMFLICISFMPSIFLSPIISVRVFKKKKGIRKTLKYAVGLKKSPGFLGRIWLKVSGIKDNDIQSYLSEMPKK